MEPLPNWLIILLKVLGNAVIVGTLIFACVSQDMRPLTLTLEFMVLLVGVGLTVIDKLVGKGEDEN